MCGVSTEQVVMIGDRDERDGECARRAGTRYLIKSTDGQPRMHHFREYADLIDSFEQGSAEDAALQ